MTDGTSHQRTETCFQGNSDHHRGQNRLSNLSWRTGCDSLCVDYKHHSYLNKPSCQVVGCTWGDTCISGRSPCPRRCADSPRCHGYTLLRLHETRQPYIIALFAGVNRWSAAFCCARTDTVSLVPGQLETRTTLAGHAPSGCLFADVGTAMLLIHTAEAPWGRGRGLEANTGTPTATGLNTQRLTR